MMMIIIIIIIDIIMTIIIIIIIIINLSPHPDDGGCAAQLQRRRRLGLQWNLDYRKPQIDVPVGDFYTFSQGFVCLDQESLFSISWQNSG